MSSAITYVHQNDSKAGLILMDVLLALSLSAIFIVLIAESSMSSRDLFNRSFEHEKMMDVFLTKKSAFEGMMPYETRSDSNASTTARAIWYGNDRIETDIRVTATGTPSTDSYEQRLTFKEVRAYPYSDPKQSVGTPLCLVDFMGENSTAVHIVPIELPINQSIPLTDLQVRNAIAYVSADSTISSDPDLFVFDLNDLNNPKFLSSINTGPGLSAISLAGQRIYAAADSTAAQLHVIRFDTLANPILEGKFKLPLPYATATAPFASSIFYDQGKVYMGTQKWDGDEFNIFDISDPLHPAKLGGLETGTQLNSIYVRNNIAYAAAADQNQLRAIDVHDPTSPTLASSFSPSGWQRQEGETLNFFEDGLAFGRTSGGFNIAIDTEAFVWASTSIARLSNPASLDDPGGVYGIVTDRSHMYLGTRQSGKEFKVFDKSFSASTTYPIAASVQSMTCDGDSIYILGHTTPVIYKVNFQ